MISVKEHTSLLVLLPSFLRCNDSYFVTTYLPYDGLAQPSRNGCSGSLAIAIDIATRYRKSPIRSIAIANRDIDSEKTTINGSEKTTITGCTQAALCPLWLKNLSSLSVFFRAFRG